MATLVESPEEANARLLDIEPNEVSTVDMPATGEPYIVLKKLETEKQGGQMSTQKLDETTVPRPVMKAIESRIKTAIESVQQIQSIAKNLPVAEDGDEKNAPASLVMMTKAATAEIRSLQPRDYTPTNKRGVSEQVLSVQELVKRYEDIEKANAVSYLMRDQYVSVTQSVTEYLSTYVEGVEHDDDGPMLIPDSLEKTVDDSAESLEKLVEEYPASEESSDDVDEIAEVTKLNSEIDRLKKALSTTKLVKDKVGKRGSKMAGERLKRLKSVSSGVGDAAVELSKLVDELEESTEGDDMADENQDTGVETTATSEDVSKAQTEPEEKKTEKSETQEVSNVEILEAMKKFSDQTNERFSKLEGDIQETKKAAEAATTTADAAQESVEKALRTRNDSRGSDIDTTTKVETKEKNAASFADLLGLSD